MESDSTHPEDRILVGKSDTFQYLLLPMACRHGLVAGATGTGKTVTLQVLAEGFSRAGTAVFAADIKGDLSGIAMPGDAKPHFIKRAQEIGMAYEAQDFPVTFWDLYGETGHPIRASISDMGPLLLARLLELNDVQEGVLNIAFRLADEQGLLLIDLKDLSALLEHLAGNAASVTKRYGNVAPATVGTIQRRVLVLENQGASSFFGEPELDIGDFLRLSRDGFGMVNILDAGKLMRAPRLYAVFLLWMLSELFEKLPEAGDLEKPKLVFFFDEAHLLFDNAPRQLLTAIEQVMRLIRSKGVGVYFVTQNPADVPETVLGQLGNRIQHALRAFTPRDQKAVKAAAGTFRQNPSFDTASAITGLGVGEALVSMLDAKGNPGIVARTLIAPPMARAGPVTPVERQQIIQKSALLGKYETAIDRPSAFEKLKERSGEAAAPAAGAGGLLGALKGALSGLFGPASGPGRKRMTAGEAVLRSAVQSAARTVGTKIGQEILRNILGGRSK